MMWLALMIAVVLVGVTVAAVLGRIDGSLADPTAPRSYIPLPPDRITPDDLDALRIDTAIRGYRMDQVDEVLDRLFSEIAALHRQVETVAAGAAAEPIESPEALDSLESAEAFESPESPGAPEPGGVPPDPRTVDQD